MTGLIRLACGVVAILGLAPWTAFPQAPEKKALLIGIDEYQSPDVSTLRGAVNDVERMQSVLTTRYGFPAEGVRVLKNAQATRANILKAIREHLIDANPPAKVAVLHFSGHGSQVRDVSNDEGDGWDETLVTHDARVGDVFDITDDEIGELLDQLAAKVEHVVFIMDSCHSGTISRAADFGATVRMAPPDLRIPPSPPGARSTARTLTGFKSIAPRHVLISGSRASELSNETTFDGVRQGALTHFLTRAMQSAGKDATYRDIMDSVSSDVTALFPTQHPELDGPNIDKVLFGTKENPVRPFVLVEPQPDGRIQILAGTLHGLRSGSLLDVFAPGARNFDDATARVGRIRITDARELSSTATLAEGSAPKAARAVLKVIGPADFALRLFIESSEVPIAAELRSRLAAHDSIKEVGAKQEAQLRLRGRGNNVVLEGPEGQALVEVAKNSPDAVDRVAKAVLHWARWHAILALDNPTSDLDVELRVQRTKGVNREPQPETVAAGSPLYYSISNRTSKPLNVIVLGMSPDGQICIIAPTPGNCRGAGSALEIAAGATIERQLGTKLLPGWERSVDILKVIATTEPIASNLFEQGPAPRDAVAKSTGDGALARLLRNSVQGARHLESVSVEGWTTRQRRIEVFNPARATASYALHFPAGTSARSGSQALGQARAVCGPGLVGNCVEVAEFRGDDTILEVRTEGTRALAGTAISVGAAFEEAYRIGQEAGATRSEPLFALSLTASRATPAALGTRGLGGEKHDPRADADVFWSHKQARVPGAWQLLRTKKGAAAGKEAAGVAIAHPDTGFLTHPEIWSGDPATNSVWAEKGRDYFREDDDATDELIDEGLLDNPAHGTGSGSAIVSPAGCQLAGAQKCPTGIAAGARLVPLRVGKSVIHFDTRRMTQAILDASGPDRSRVKADTQVMSISMGGVPSWALWKAVTKAESRGYLIIAAAGNYVGTVVWPARFESVISVAATNFGCRPWDHTSKGSRVDFSAPGESVWRATINDSKTFITGMGIGTTYATATTAGVAALWVALNKDDPAFEQLRKDGRMVQAFRTAARETATRPGAADGKRADCDAGVGWKADEMGAGIIDATALLSRPLPGATRSSPRAMQLEDLPLWTSIYAPGTSRDVIVSDYQKLFGASNLATVGMFEAEVVHQYAVDEAVQRAADRIVAGAQRDADSFGQLRAALRRADLSTRLRTALPPG